MSTSCVKCVKCGLPIERIAIYVNGYGPICNRGHLGDPKPITAAWTLPTDDRSDQPDEQRS